MLHIGFANWSRLCLVVWASLLMLPIALVFAEPPHPPLTAEQREKLKERDRLSWEVNRLNREGKVAEAIAAAEKMLAIERQVFGDVNADVVESLEWLAGLHQKRDDVAAARKARQEVLTIRVKLHGEKHWKVTDARLALADVESLGRMTPRQRQRLAEAKRLYGEADALYRQGRFREAIELACQLLEVRKQTLGEQHPFYATSLNNLAELYRSQGDYAKAEPFCRQASEIWKQALGEQHPFYATSLNNLALLYSSQGDYAKAEPLCRQASEIWKQALGEQHPDYATSLNNLAVQYDFQGDYAKAEPLYRQALEIRKQALGEKHPAYAASLNNLAGLYQSQGDYAKAEPLFREALAIKKQALGEQHPGYAGSLYGLAALFYSQGDYAKAEPLCYKALAISRDNLELAAALQSQRQQLAMLEDLRYILDTYLSLATEAKQPAERPYEPVLAWKGAVSLRQRNQRLAQRHPELSADFAELDRVAARLAALALSVPDPKQQEVHHRQIQELTEEKERLEGQLARRSADFRKEKEPRRLTPAQLQAVLLKDAVLLDFLEYTHRSPSVEKKGQWKKERRLLAFVVRRDSLVRVDLGPVKPIKESIDHWRVALQRRFRTAGDAQLGADVRELLWHKLEEHLHGAKTVLISPDGALSSVPFAALPGSKKDSYLLEELALAVVPVPQLLPELLTPRPGTDKDEPSLMLVGDVDYGALPGSAADAVVSRSAPRANRQSTLAAALPLEGTRAEILAVRDSFEERFPDGRVKMLRKAQATEEAVRRQAPKHRYLHLATHGFFAPKELRNALSAASRGKDGDAGNLFGGRKGVAGFHPGLLSGLVLAGANRPAQVGQDDGILTALEVESLDLGGVELAVLSACETGLGEEAGGEGLLGLQRAFQVAGARSVAAGVWQVDDKATRDLMMRFYENLWKKKLPKLEALRQAQLWMLKEGVGRGMIDVRVPKERLAKEDGRLPPYYWAAFVLSGDWR